MSEQLKKRTKNLFLRIHKVIEALPKNISGRNIGNQLFRSASSVAANYRATLRSRSKAEFRAKLGIVIEECDESLFWLELIEELELIETKKLTQIKKETEEVLKIMVSARKSSGKK